MYIHVYMYINVCMCLHMCMCILHLYMYVETYRLNYGLDPNAVGEFVGWVLF